MEHQNISFFNKSLCRDKFEMWKGRGSGTIFVEDDVHHISCSMLVENNIPNKYIERSVNTMLHLGYEVYEGKEILKSMIE